MEIFSKLTAIIFGLYLLFTATFLLPDSRAETNSNNQSATNLKELIEGKNKELQELQAQREAIEKELEGVNKTSASLKKELQIVNSSINQLNLSIKGNKLVLEKLELEIDSLKNEIKDTEESIQNKKSTIVKLLIELQQRDKENILIIVLKNKSLAESVAEAQSIAKLNSNLSSAVEQFRGFQDQLTKKLDEGEKKKRSREIENANLLNRQAIVQEQKNEKQKVLTQTKNQEKIYQLQIAELEKKQLEIGDELEKIENELRASFDPTLLPMKRPGVLTYPTQEPRIVTQAYGKTKFAERAYKTKFHNGIDFNASIGTPIMAAADGTIKAVGNNGRLQYGKFVLIEHDNNLSTLYAHLSKYVAQAGAVVKKGDIIGYAGNTGYSTGPHIHLTLYWTPSVTLKSFPGAGLVPVGITIDPADYL